MSLTGREGWDDTHVVHPPRRLPEYRYWVFNPKVGKWRFANVWENTAGAWRNLTVKLWDADELLGESDLQKRQHTKHDDYAAIDSELEPFARGQGDGFALYLVSAVIARDTLGVKGVESAPGSRSGMAGRLWARLKLFGLAHAVREEKVTHVAYWDRLDAEVAMMTGYVKREKGD